MQCTLIIAIDFPAVLVNPCCMAQQGFFRYAGNNGAQNGFGAISIQQLCAGSQFDALSKNQLAALTQVFDAAVGYRTTTNKFDTAGVLAQRFDTADQRLINDQVIKAITAVDIGINRIRPAFDLNNVIVFAAINTAGINLNQIVTTAAIYAAAKHLHDIVTIAGIDTATINLNNIVARRSRNIGIVCDNPFIGGTGLNIATGLSGTDQNIIAAVQLADDLINIQDGAVFLQISTGKAVTGQRLPGQA